MDADLGQHFLVDERAIARVLGVVRPQPGERALDLGAGAGALTAPLSRAVAPDGRVVAVELDRRLAAELRARKLPGVEVVQGDLLRVPIPRADVVVANPPFRPLPPILLRLLDAGFGRAALVMPAELAERLTAQPGDERYGRLTVRVGVFADVRVVFRLPRAVFEPAPAVDVVVARVDPKASDVDPATLEAVLEAAWSARKRTFRHAVGTLAAERRVSSGAVTQALREGGFESLRPTEAPVEAYAAVARALRRP